MDDSGLPLEETLRSVAEQAESPRQKRVLTAVRSRVLEHSGIMLQWEIKRLGNFMPGYEVKEFLGRATA